MTQDNKEKSLKDVIVKILSIIKYLRSKWLSILIASILGGFLGLGYAIFKKPKYTATCTFVLEESSKGGGLGQFAGLASLAGVDLNGVSGGGGLFQGDNILELYTSRLMIERTLLSEANFNGKTELLIDRYVDFNRLKKRWKEKDNIDNITFSGDPEHFNREQDSIITDIVEVFNKKILSVTKPDKKLTIIRVDVTINDELFAKEFTNTLVETVNNFYIQTKTKRSYNSVRLLQKQADSVRQVLNASLSGVASAIESAPNANPLFSSLKVPSQRKQIDVQASTAVYSEVVKNLEVSRFTLRQETPLIQVIDKPVLPLHKDYVGKLKAIFIGVILGAFIVAFILLLRKSLRTMMSL